MEARRDISVVVPVYNSMEGLEELYDRLHKTLLTMDKSFEVVFVDDSSKDKSYPTLKKIKAAHPDTVRLIGLARNYGQHNATLCGFRHARGEYIYTLDDDLQHQPEDLPKLLEELESSGADVVYAVSEQHRTGYRKAASKVWKFSAQHLDDGLGQGSSYRLLKRDVVEKMAAHSQHVIYIDELLQWYTSHIGTVKVEFKPRPYGRSQYTPVKLWFTMFNFSVFYSGFPLRAMTYGGLVLAAITAFIGVRIIIRKLGGGIDEPGYASIIVAILFSTSLLLICFGIVGQYLSKIYTVLNNKPTYSIRDRDL